MANAAGHAVDNAPDATPMDYVGRLKANLNELIGHYEERLRLSAAEEKEKVRVKERIAKGAGLSTQTLDNLRDPRKTNSSVRHLVQAFVNLGRAPATMFLPIEEFRASLVNDPPVPLRPESPLESLVSSSSGLMSSGASSVIARPNWPTQATTKAKKRAGRSARTSPSDASNRCFMHTRRDQHRWVRASGGTYRKETFRVHLLRPAGTPVRVTSTDDQRQVA